MEEFLKNCLASWESIPIQMHKFKRHRDLLPLFRYLKFKKGAEIGVYRGYFSCKICECLNDVDLICVDPWIMYDYDRADTVPKAKIDPENDYAETVRLLSPYKVTIMRMTSMEAVKLIPLESLDFVYIDANHYYKYIKEDLIEWSKRVRSGGIVSGDDYRNSPNCDVIQAVNEYVKENGIDRWYLTDDLSNNYFWRKP